MALHSSIQSTMVIIHCVSTSNKTEFNLKKNRDSLATYSGWSIRNTERRNLSRPSCSWLFSFQTKNQQKVLHAIYCVELLRKSEKTHFVRSHKIILQLVWWTCWIYLFRRRTYRRRSTIKFIRINSTDTCSLYSANGNWTNIKDHKPN